MEHHNDNPITVLMVICTFILAGIGHMFETLQSSFHGMGLHYILAGCQGFMFFISGIVGLATLYRMFFKKDKK